MAGTLKHEFKTGQEALIHAIFMRSGGVQRVATAMNMTRQKVNQWRAYGWVPLKYCGMLARALNCPVFGFNYRESIMFLGHDAVPSWKKVVSSYDLSPDTVEHILSFPEPERDI